MSLTQGFTVMGLFNWRSLLSGKATPSKAARARKSAPPARRVQLALERLEARDVPTVIIAPHFPGEHVLAATAEGTPLDNPNAALKNPSVYLLFADDQVTAGTNRGYWITHTDELVKIQQDVKQIVEGSFLSGLSPYGYGRASFIEPLAGTYGIDPKAPIFVNAADTDPDSIRIALELYLSEPDARPALDRISGATNPIVVVVTAPTILQAQGPQGLGGVNFSEGTGSTVWVGTQYASNHLVLDEREFTTAFSRQLANAVAGQIRVALPSPYDGTGQIADGEAQAYRVRIPSHYANGIPDVNGIMVQPYWSDSNTAFGGVAIPGAFIVPDGNQQSTLEKPNWSDDTTFVRLDEADTGREVVRIKNPGGNPVEPVTALPPGNVAEFDNLFYRTTTDADGHIFIATSVDGKHYSSNPATPKSLLRDLFNHPETAVGYPSLAVYDNQLYIAWTGTDSAGHLNIAVVTLDSSGKPTGHTSRKQPLGYTSEHAPAIASYDNALFLAFVGVSDSDLRFDFITRSDPVWGHHLFTTTADSEGAPGLADDKAHDRLVVGYTGEVYGDELNQVILEDKPAKVLIPLPALVGGVLTVDGNQSAGTNDRITLDQSPAGAGVRLTLDGVVRDYAPGAVSKIVFDTGFGTNTVSVLATPAGVTTVINALGHTAVDVGYHGSMGRIKGDLSIRGAYHSVDLTLDDSRDRVGRTIVLASQAGVESVIGMAPNSTIRFGKSDLSQFTLQTSFGSNNVLVYDTPDTSNFTSLYSNGRETNNVAVMGTTGRLKVVGQNGRSRVAVFPAGNREDTGFLGAIKGSVDVSNTFDSTTALVINDASDTLDHRNVVLDRARLSGLSADITWQIVTPVIVGVVPAGGVSSLTLIAGTGTNTFTVANPAFYFNKPVRIAMTGGNDTINVENTVGSLLVDLGTGTDTVNVSPTAHNLRTIGGAVTVTGGFGGHGKLWIDDQASPTNNTYRLTATGVLRNSATAINYSGLQEIHLNGGAGNDTFAVVDGGPITLDGGAGVNTLDYSGFSGGVTVDLPLGTATATAGIRDIQNVIGGPGNDILVGNGGNVLTGGTGRNLLIAGSRASTLIGNGNEDILVGGTTDYDTKRPALDALMAEWSRTDLPYGSRVQNLLAGGLNGLVPLDISTFHSNGGNNTLTGAAGRDLFYGLLPGDTGTPDKTDWNAILGEIFIDPNGEHAGIRIDARALTTPTLTLDYTTAEQTAEPFAAVLLPGSHVLTAPGGAGTFSFTVGPDGTVGYDPSLEGVLSGRGTRRLMVGGSRVTVDATALTATSLSLDYYTSERTASPFQAVLLPGSHLLSGVGGAVSITIDPDGTFRYPVSEDNLLSGRGSRTLIVKILS